jgi:hypothetical protein
MAESIYSQIGKQMGKDVRLVRAAAHHPFEFFSKVMEDPEDHRPVRFRYFGAFFVKPYWRKGLKNPAKVGYPTEGQPIWARVPEKKFNKIYINLKQGQIIGQEFHANDESVVCPITDIAFWGPCL